MFDHSLQNTLSLYCAILSLSLLPRSLASFLILSQTLAVTRGSRTSILVRYLDFSPLFATAAYENARGVEVFFPFRLALSSAQGFILPAPATSGPAYSCLKS